MNASVTSGFFCIPPARAMPAMTGIMSPSIELLRGFHLLMYRMSEDVFGCLHERLRQRRMRVDRLGDRLRRRLELQRGAAFHDQLRGARADDVHAEDLVVLLVGDVLHEADRL